MKVIGQVVELLQLVFCTKCISFLKKRLDKI